LKLKENFSVFLQEFPVDLRGTKNNLSRVPLEKRSVPGRVEYFSEFNDEIPFSYLCHLKIKNRCKKAGGYRDG
jgi:hypothetical protein